MYIVQRDPRGLSEDQAVRTGSKPTRGRPKILKIFCPGPHCSELLKAVGPVPLFPALYACT